MTLDDTGVLAGPVRTHQVWEWLLGPLEMEAIVLAEGVHFAWEVAICDVVFESDSKIVSNAVLHNTTPPIAIANIIMGIQ